MKLMRLNTAVLSIFTLAAVISPNPADATGSPATPWEKSADISVRLISASHAVGAEDTLDLGLHFKLEPGWRIYWENTTGYSFHPRLDASGSQNVASLNLLWPVPTRIPVYDHITLGYQREVVLPIIAKLAEPGKATRFQVKVIYLACSEICIPSTANFNLEIPSGDSNPSEFAQLIEQYRGKIPINPSDQDIDFDLVQGGTGKRPTLKVVATSTTPFRAPDLVVGGPESFEFSEPKVTLSEGGRKATFEVPTVMIDDFEPERLQGKELTVILSDSGRNVGKILTVSEVAMASSPWAKLVNFVRNLLPSDG
jgi:suppressor for copper-sensitivity B